MEIAIAEVSRHRVDKLVLIEDCLKFRHEFRKIFGFDDDVVDKRSGALAANVFSKEVEALPADTPIFFRLALVLSDVHLVAEMCDLLFVSC